MQVMCVAAVFLFLVLPGVTEAEYIHITLPQEVTYRPCGPGEVRWESDIDPGEGNVLRVRWHEWGMTQQRWYSLGMSSNDGVQPWPNPPCDMPEYPYFIAYTVQVDYITDPSICDSVRFYTGASSIDGPTIFVDFSGNAPDFDHIQSRVDPPPYTSIEAYVGLAGVPGGFNTVSFAMELTQPGVVVLGGFVNLLPGNLEVGSWDSGITLASTECMGSNSGLVYLGYLELFYIDGAGDVLIIDHPDYPRWVVNCAEPGEVLEYVVGSHGGVWKEPASTPVEPKSWGSIKAMYRQ